jgi:hypothetical protein
METVYDWLTVAIFAMLVTLFLHRSSTPEPPSDSIWQYLLASVGCGVTNYLGNEGWHFAAVPVLLITLAYIFFALRPFEFPSGR